MSVDSTIALELRRRGRQRDDRRAERPAAGAGIQAATAPAQNQLGSTLHAHPDRHPAPRPVRPDAGVWTDLLAPADSEVGGLDDLLDDLDLGVTFASERPVPVGRRRDHRQRHRSRGGCWSMPTRRTRSSPATRPPTRVCSPWTRRSRAARGKRRSTSHVLDFDEIALGVRAPVVQRFSDSTSTLRWLLPRPPVVAAAVGPPGGVPVARVLISSATDLVARRRDLRRTGARDRHQRLLDVRRTSPTWAARWSSRRTADSSCRTARCSRCRTAARPLPIRCFDTRGLTSVTLRYRRSTKEGDTKDPSGEWLEIRNMRYTTVREERDRLADQGRCQAQAAPVASPAAASWRGCRTTTTS